ncbi:PEP-CTERM sorting domain-containing protein [Catenovulum sediminis]|uniref:PEP-CTERM sorting domain-containing protein n=1 Tax=Catenovulum sediminis TaxID=1740262 RepID=A0ABV1RG45_9ALTE|nr:PEP-CTERM sorting domain-containing protein [Catenovulum sediminis]
MKNLTKLSVALMMSAVSSLAHAGTVISNWTYINEAGFINATTGKNVKVSGADTTLDPNTLQPLASTGRVTPNNSNDWVYNPSTGLHYDLGASGYEAGQSITGVSAGASGEFIGTSILSSGNLIDEICWGNGPSCLSFSGASGEDLSRVEGVANLGQWNQGTNMSHDNRPTGSPSLTSIDVVDGLKLFSDELLFDLPTLELGFDVIFNETYANAGSLWPYAPDDAFIITLNSDLSSSISNFGPDFIDITVELDLTGLVDAGYHTEYAVVTRLQGLELVSTPAGNTFGFVTPEGSNNELQASFAIRAVGIPEPASIAVFGLGLLGLASARRRTAK